MEVKNWQTRVIRDPLESIKRIKTSNRTLRDQIISRHSFGDDDGLGYQYEGCFCQKIIYGRLMKSTSFEQWKQLITLSPNKNEARRLKGKPIQYLSGIFIDLKKPEEIINNKAYLSSKTNLPFLNSTESNFNEHKISFSASYFSANLLYVFEKGESEYDLLMHSDTNSKGSTQWFNFEVSLKRQGYYKFNIVNFTKSSSLYNKGMGVLMKKQNGEWMRVNNDLSYGSNSILIQDSNPSRPYRTLTFTYLCHKQQTIQFSYGYPYSHEDLDRFWSSTFKKIKEINNEGNENPNIKFTKQIIGKTKSGLLIEAYCLREEQKNKFRTISRSLKTSRKEKQKKSIVFLARQHPGETQSSFIVEGIIKFLIKNTGYLFHSGCLFYFIPMINIEGVVYGNYRTNISGVDLNRNWRFCNRARQPEVCAIKNYLENIDKNSPISLIIDLHGHSKSFNSFFYGVDKNRLTINSKSFPFYCSKKSSKFSYEQSNFDVAENKKNTARVVLSDMFPEALVYTLQNSFYGYKNGDQFIQYTPEQLRNVGSDLIEFYFEYARLCKSGKKDAIKKLEEQLQIFQKKILKKKKGQSYDSDSEAELQLNQQPEDQISRVPDGRIQITKKTQRKFPEKLRTQKSESVPKQKGSYLKTIQIIDSSRENIGLKDMVKQPRNQPKRRQGIERNLRPILYLKNRPTYSQNKTEVEKKSSTKSTKLICGGKLAKILQAYLENHPKSNEKIEQISQHFSTNEIIRHRIYKKIVEVSSKTTGPFSLVLPSFEYH